MSYPTRNLHWLFIALAAMISVPVFAAEPAVAPAPTADEVVRLSPFEVSGTNRGYQATNTMSGTRLNTKLEDLAASISVITKEQMADFAMLDMNDVFLYEASAEGTQTYTAFELGRQGYPTAHLSHHQ